MSAFLSQSVLEVSSIHQLEGKVTDLEKGCITDLVELLLPRGTWVVIQQMLSAAWQWPRTELVRPH